MKRYTKEELDEILRKHKLWLLNDPEGKWANLGYADLRGVNLGYADLEHANLRHANLRGADLGYANLRGADLRVADLRYANLRYADLRGADLRGADLEHANLGYANLRGANLGYADLRVADLRYANLGYADLRGANLRYADLRGAENLQYPISCPEKGSFTAFKKASEYIIELLIPEDAKRCSATGRRCRCDSAKVVSITNIDGSDSGLAEVPSNYDNSFIYTVGEYVSVEDFDDNRWNERAPGIHFFITRDEAVNH